MYYFLVLCDFVFNEHYWSGLSSKQSLKPASVPVHPPISSCTLLETNLKLVFVFQLTRCPFCVFFTENMGDLQEHITTKHLENPKKTRSQNDEQDSTPWNSSVPGTPTSGDITFLGYTIHDEEFGEEDSQISSKTQRIKPSNARKHIINSTHSEDTAITPKKTPKATTSRKTRAQTKNSSKHASITAPDQVVTQSRKKNNTNADLQSYNFQDPQTSSIGAAKSLTKSPAALSPHPENSDESGKLTMNNNRDKRGQLPKTPLQFSTDNDSSFELIEIDDDDDVSDSKQSNFNLLQLIHNERKNAKATLNQRKRSNSNLLQQNQSDIKKSKVNVVTQNEGKLSTLNLLHSNSNLNKRNSLRTKLQSELLTPIKTHHKDIHPQAGVNSQLQDQTNIQTDHCVLVSPNKDSQTQPYGNAQLRVEPNNYLHQYDSQIIDTMSAKDQERDNLRQEMNKVKNEMSQMAKMLSSKNSQMSTIKLLEERVSLENKKLQKIITQKNDLIDATNHQLTNTISDLEQFSSVKSDLKKVLCKDATLCQKLTGQRDMSNLNSKEMCDVISYVIVDYVESRKRHSNDVEKSLAKISALSKEVEKHQIFVEKFQKQYTEAQRSMQTTSKHDQEVILMLKNSLEEKWNQNHDLKKDLATISKNYSEKLKEKEFMIEKMQVTLEENDNCISSLMNQNNQQELNFAFKSFEAGKEIQNKNERIAEQELTILKLNNTLKFYQDNAGIRNVATISEPGVSNVSVKNPALNQLTLELKKKET